MKYLPAFALFLLSVPVSAQRLLVPDEYSTIQAAIDAAADGDSVIVAPGTYTENIRFNGKAIVVASFFALDSNVAHIEDTVIDGSEPAAPDTASVVLFIDGEGPGSVLEGFTITGGTGTRWLDEHGAGRYVEGGGILAALSSPTIRFNIIAGNSADRIASTVSAGGGGIRAGDGAAVIENNVIVNNRAMYGGGIVSNYADTIIRNNVIAHNEVYQAVAGRPTFGGGGVWTNGEGATVVENNTIVSNTSSGSNTTAWAGRAGGLLASKGMEVIARNNIIWGNTQERGDGQVYEVGGTISTEYNDIEGGFTSASGTHIGDLDADPVFAPGTFLLTPTSPAVDAGHPDVIYNDPEAPEAPGQAAAPAQGTVRNDMGAYGGPGARRVGTFSVDGAPTLGPLRRAVAAYPNPTSGEVTVAFTLDQAEAGTVSVYDMRGALVRTLDTRSWSPGMHTLRWDSRDASGRRVPSGSYFLRLQTGHTVGTERIIVVQNRD